MNPTTTASVIAEALHYVKQFVGARILIKLGGSILDDPKLIKQLCIDLSLLRASGIAVAIVHGGSKAIETELKIHQIESKFHNGLRITSDTMMDIIEMVLCGHVNKTLVRTLNTVGVPAIGLSGSDNNMLSCCQLDTTLQRVGKVTKVNAEYIEHSLQQQLQSRHAAIPVIAPIGVNQDGQAMNINADWAASNIATALNMNKLIYLTDQDGVFDKEGQLLSKLNLDQCQQLIDQETVVSGMLTKINTIISALKHGLNNIHIISGKRQHALIEELFTEKGIGTVCIQT